MSTSTIATRFAIEPAGLEHDAPLRALLRDTPMGESIQVAFLREPSFFLTSDIQGTFVQTFVGLRDARLIGTGTRAIRPSWVNGLRCEAGYLADLRLRKEDRGGTYVARAFRFLRELHADGRVSVYSTVVVDDNRAALETIAANRAGLPCYAPLGRVLTPAIYLRRRMPKMNGDVVRGRADMLPDIVSKLNENRLQFAPAWTVDDFANGRLHGFRAEDFYVLRRKGKIAGVLAKWDQRSFRQTVVLRYQGWLGRLRPLVNVVRWPPLPRAGVPLSFFYVAFLSTDDVEAFAILLRHVYRENAFGAYTHCTVGLHERDPRAAVLKDYGHTPFAGRLFAVTFDRPPELDDRVPYVEAALL
jgi:hypothetical protein